MANPNVSGDDFLAQQAQTLKERYEFLTQSTSELEKLRASYLALTGEQLAAISMDADLDDLREELEAAKNQRDAFRSAKDDAETRRVQLAKRVEELEASLDSANTRYAEAAPRLRAFEQRVEDLVKERDEAQQLLEQATAPDQGQALDNAERERLLQALSDRDEQIDQLRAQQPESKEAREQSERQTFSWVESLRAYFEDHPEAQTLREVATGIGTHPESLRRALGKLVEEQFLLLDNDSEPYKWRRRPPLAEVKPQPKLAPGFTKKELGLVRPYVGEVAAVIAANFKPGVWWTTGELRALLDANDSTTKHRINELVDQGFLRWNEGWARGSKYTYTGKPVRDIVGAPEEQGQKEEEEEQPEDGTGKSPPAAVEEDTFGLVRQWCETELEYGDAMSPQRVALALDIKRVEALEALEALAEKGKLSDDSPSDDMRIFSKVKPEHVVKSEQRAVGRPPQRGQAKRGEPVAGTGKTLTITDSDVRALVQDAVRAGAQPSMADNGHIDIRWGNRRVQISHTPKSARTVANDRSRLRREGLAV